MSIHAPHEVHPTSLYSLFAPGPLKAALPALMVFLHEGPPLLRLRMVRSCFLPCPQPELSFFPKKKNGDSLTFRCLGRSWARLPHLSSLSTFFCVHPYPHLFFFFESDLFQPTVVFRPSGERARNRPNPPVHFGVSGFLLYSQAFLEPRHSAPGPLSNFRYLFLPAPTSFVLSRRIRPFSDFFYFLMAPFVPCVCHLLDFRSLIC